jgi:hypothetical protein
MNDRNISIQGRIKQFALKAIKLYSFINKSFHFNSFEVIISQQFLRSSTSINEIFAEAENKLINKNKEKLLTSDF